jgi:DNA-binding HxlR family transcriptional regulator
VYAYKHIEAETGFDRNMLKEVMQDLRNNGIVELIPAVNYDGVPCGSGWSLTEKGMIYAVDKELVVI